MYKALLFSLVFLSSAHVFSQEITPLNEADLKCQEARFYLASKKTRLSCSDGVREINRQAKEGLENSEAYVRAQSYCRENYEITSHRIGCFEGLVFYSIAAKWVEGNSQYCLKHPEVNTPSACQTGVARAQLALWATPPSSSSDFSNLHHAHIQGDDGSCFREYFGNSPVDRDRYADCFIGLLHVYHQQGYLSEELTTVLGLHENRPSRPEWLTSRYSLYVIKYR